MFVPVHVKSAYSLGVGTAPVERLVDRASALGLEAMALTDVNNLYGALVFHRLARARGIRPLIGAEIPLGGAPPERLVLLARSRAGYDGLCRLITRCKLEPCFNPLEGLPSCAEGLLILTDRPETMARLLALSAGPAPGITRDALRFLLVRPPPGGPGGGLAGERRLLDAAAAWKVPAVADADIGFLDPEDHALHRVLAAIHGNGLVDAMAEPDILAPGRYFPGPREWAERFAEQPGAMAEAERIAGLCDLDLSPARPIFPRIDLPPGETAFTALARRCFQGVEARYRRITPAVLERLHRELATIEAMGFCEYFLVVGGIVRFARERGIEVVGRGSGAGSIVTYILGVTNVDPIAHGLHFERFLHPLRADLPDIDIDLCWIRRDEVIAHVYETYGADRTAMISSHITYQSRSAFREAARAFGAPALDVDTYSKWIPHHCDGPLAEAIAAAPMAREIPRDEEPYRSAIRCADRIVGLPHHLSIHPGGIVIGDRPLDRLVPLERAAKGIVVTQYDMHSIEDVGLVKIDLLGNRCLTEIQETLELAAGPGPPAGAPGPPAAARPRPGPQLSDIPDGDAATAALLREGRTVGCFQIESPAMRALLCQLRVESVRDCIVAVALIRPGPSEGGMRDRYVRRARGEEPVGFTCPEVRRVLEENLGIILYEEDVMRVAAAVAGISLADGDVLRSRLKKCAAQAHYSLPPAAPPGATHAGATPAAGDGPKPDALREMENDFLRRAISRGTAPDAARAVWQDLLRSSRYTFNKAHAAGYGLLAYQAAYLKAHFPVEFACALLNNHAGMYSTRTIAEEARRMGVRLLPPCLNRSGGRHGVEDQEGAKAAVLPAAEATALGSAAAVPGAPGPAPSTPWRRALRIGLVQIKGLSTEALEAILRGRPFRCLGDLLRRTRIPRREIEALVLAGALDFTGLNRPQLLWELETTYDRECGRGSLGLAAAGGQEWCGPAHPPLKDYSQVVKVRREMEVLELAIETHPLALLRGQAAREGCIPIAEALRRPGAVVRVAGLLAASRKTPTRGGATMQFLTLEDESGILEATLFPAVHRQFCGCLRNLGPYIAEGTMGDRQGALSLDVRRVAQMES